MELYISHNDCDEPAIVFTRYLYIKQEVKIALLASLLNKSDDALFWAYELYYSGFVYELFELLLRVYYDFYAVLNDAFEIYLIKKMRDVLKNYNSHIFTQDKVIGSIIKNFMERPYNSDIFMLQNVCSIFDVDCGCIEEANTEHLIKLWITEDDYLSISQFVLNEYTHKKLQAEDIYSIVLDAFNENGLQINKAKEMASFTRSNIITIDSQKRMLAKIMQLFARKHKLTLGKNKYVNFDVCETIFYETLDHKKEDIKNYRVLQHACKLGVDDQKYLHLFQIARNKLTQEEVMKMYNYSWDYYASWSPFWATRIASCDGSFDHINKRLIFEDDDMFEVFHNYYSYEPDEQPLSVKHKSITPIEAKVKWTDFYEKHKNENLFKLDDDMLVELCERKIFYTK